MCACVRVFVLLVNLGAHQYYTQYFPFILKRVMHFNLIEFYWNFFYLAIFVVVLFFLFYGLVGCVQIEYRLLLIQM